MKINNSGRKGYILMEVMLAAGIFAMAGVALAVALNDIAKNYTSARKLNGIRTELGSRINEARIQPVAPGKEVEPESPTGVTFTKEIVPLQLNRTVHVQSLTSTQPMVGYYRITINADWVEGNSPQNEKAEIYVYQP